MSVLYKNSSGDVVSLIPEINNIDDSTIAADTTYSSEKIEGSYPITATATGSDLTLFTSSGNLNALTVYGKSEVVDGNIKSAGEGYGVVDLGTLEWSWNNNQFYSTQISNAPSSGWVYNILCSKYVQISSEYARVSTPHIRGIANQRVYIVDSTYTDDTVAFKAAMSGVMLVYPLADPTQGNAIAIKTDNGTGINGTMAVFETGTPLRGIPDTTVRDVMVWNGSAGEVVKNCAKVRLADLTWSEPVVTEYRSVFEAIFVNFKQELNDTIAPNLLTVNFQAVPNNSPWVPGDISNRAWNNSIVLITEPTITTVTDLKASLGDAELVYELATPTTQQLTTAENASIAGLRTFAPQTHVQNNAGAEMTVEAYAGTQNGKAVQELENRIKSEIDEVKNEKSHFCYSYKIDKNNSDPATCVKPHFDTRYGCDNFNFTSAHMDYANDRFDYGSWEGFIRRIARPCMLKYDGTVDYYLDPDDYSKKITGEASDVTDVNYQGNAMVELEKLYFKRYTHNGIQYCFIADRKLDKSFKAYAHHDKYGKELNYIYRACYDGMYDGTRLRSISGIDYHNLNALTAGYIMSNATRQEEMNFAKANNVSTEQGEGWNILHKSEWDYINDILVLISMSTDTQGTFGRGRDSGYVSTSDTGIISTGTMDTKGLFWGKNDGSAGVKVLGIENHWANIWKSCAGWMLISNQHYTKMTFGTEDGSTGTGFNTDGTGYLATGASISANGYISDWAENDNGFLPTATSGSASTYRCDYVWQNTATYFALVGGGSAYGLPCGAFCANLGRDAGNRSWYVGAALSYKPLAGGELAA